MRGPHNIFRLIRVGATLERTGAMNLILAAYRAPWGVRMAAKIIGWPFQWLGYRGDPMMPAATRLRVRYYPFSILDLKTRTL